MLEDVLDGYVSPAVAREDYGVVLAGEDDDLAVDEAATRRLRAERRAAAAAPKGA